MAFAEKEVRNAKGKQKHNNNRNSRRFQCQTVVSISTWTSMLSSYLCGNEETILSPRFQLDSVSVLPCNSNYKSC